MTVTSEETVTPVRPAATVILLRDSPAGLEVWLLTRVRGMAFASGMTVFPGGRADAADVDLPWAAGGPARFSTGFGCDEVEARMLVGAAVRETFEETGVLLTRPELQLGPATLAAVQQAVEAGRLPFRSVLEDHCLAIDAEALQPWGRWITPAGEPRRYDTHFFVAAVPAGAEAAALTTEAASASWVPVADALLGVERGERELLPPTRAMLMSLEGHTTVEDVFAAAAGRDLQPVCPVRIVLPGGVRIEHPDGRVLGFFPRRPRA